MRTRLLPLLLCFLVVPGLHAQFEFDTTTLAGRVVTRRMVAMSESPEMKERVGAGAVNFDYFNVTAMDDTTLSHVVRLMARGLEREESEDCPAALSGSSDPNALFFVILGSVTDSAEAEEWADMLERAIWGLAGQPRR